MESKKENAVIFVDGHVVGYQFNQKSMGKRTFRRQVEVPENGTITTVYIGLLGRDIRIQRLYNSRFWEALP